MQSTHAGAVETRFSICGMWKKKPLKRIDISSFLQLFWHQKSFRKHTYPQDCQKTYQNHSIDAPGPKK